MPTQGPPIDEGILVRMLALSQYKMKSKDVMITLITHGLNIIEDDERILDQHMITRSHFTLPGEDKEAVIAAAVYRRMAGYDDTRDMRNR